LTSEWKGAILITVEEEIPTPMIDHSWAENAMRCCAQRIKNLRPVEHYSWAHYLQQRERETLTALYELNWKQ
jgi:hypothetical protein